MLDLSMNYVLGGKQQENPIILKLGFKKPSMKCFAGNHCVKLLNEDPELGALLLERLNPGQSLKSFFPSQDAQAIRVACEVIKELQSVPPLNQKQFPNLSDWFKILDTIQGIPPQYLKKAKAIGTNLLATTTKTILLHGDLHHENILSSGNNNWVAIDPQGVIGDPVYEVGPFIRNPLPEITQHPDVKNIIQTRISLFTDYFT